MDLASSLSSPDRELELTAVIVCKARKIKKILTFTSKCRTSYSSVQGPFGYPDRKLFSSEVTSCT